MNTNIFHRVVNYFKVDHAIILIPVCAFAIFDSVFNSFSSVLALIGDDYRDASQVAIQMILSVPSLLAIPTMLVSGLLASRVHKRTLGLVAMGIMFAGAMLPWAYRSTGIWVLFASSITIGIAQGLLHPLASSVVIDTWQKGRRKKVLGFKQAANYLGASICTLLVGALASTGWRNSYLVYLLLIPAFLVTYFRMPQGKLDKRIVTSKQTIVNLREMANRSTVYLLLLFMFAAIFQFTFYSNIAMSTKEHSFGTSVETSQITAIAYVCSFVVGILFSKVSDVCKERTLAIGFLIEASGLAVAASAPSFEIVLLGGALFGTGSCMQEVSTIFYLSRERSARGHATMLISMGLICINLGIAVSPVLVSFAKSNILHSSTASAGMLVGSIGFIVLAVIEMGYRRHLKRLGVREEWPNRPRNH
jgi:MFS family permease